MNDRQYGGVFRGVIESRADPEMRKRYRVRVFTVHPEVVPVDALPWAETAMFAGKFFGDLPSYEVGDRVFVMFEGGNRRFPVIVGGFLAAASGVPDAPAEVRAEYDRTQDRWLRLDRVGNLIEMSPLPKERWIRVKAGESEILLRQNDGTIELLANAQVRVVAPQVEIEAAEQITATTKVLFAQCQNEATLRSDGVVNIQGSTKINIGRYEDPLLGPAAPVTSDEVDVRANNNVKVESGGTLDIDAVQDVTLDTDSSARLHAATEINIYGESTVVVRSDGDVAVEAGGKVTVDAQDDITVTGGLKLVVNTTTAVEVNAGTACTIIAQGGDLKLDAQAANLNLTALGNVNVSGSAAVTVDAVGTLTLRSSSQVSIEAPIVSASANAQLTLDGGALASLNAAIVRIA